MPDTILSYTIPETKKDEYIEAYCYVHKNTETIQDPNADPEVNTPIPKYTDPQWVREHIMRSIRGQIVRGKNAMAKDGLVQSNADDII